jgi:hypothetical protein
MTFKKVLLLLTLAGIFLPSVLQASGSYTSSAPRPTGAIDQARYNLGKQIYSGKMQLPAQSSAAELEQQQRERLGSLQLRLPEKVQKKVQLTHFAGRLDPEQLEALEYFLSIRYKLEAN